jgi:hypothetical protein
MRQLVPVMVAIAAMANAPILASAELDEVTISTSADAFGRMFFGEGVIRVIVTDPDAGDDDAIDDIAVDIDADPETGLAGSDSFVIPETGESSDRFEFFIAHVDADEVDPADIDSRNNAGVEGDGTCAADCAPIITFGPAGDLDVASDLFEETEFEIKVGNTVIEVHYEETAGRVSLDREAYPSSAFVYVYVRDQDVNLNPTARDAFVVDPDDDPNRDLLTLDGGAFLDEVAFEETGDNTAVFEGRYSLGTTIDVDSESFVLTLHEKANYDATLDEPENDSNEVDKVSFTVGDTSGTISVGGQQTWDPTIAADKDSYSAGEAVHLTITDFDANLDPDTIDSIELQLSSGSEISALETGENTGVFEASFSPSIDVTVTYTDRRPADYSEKIASGESPEQDFILQIDVEPVIKTGVQATTVTAPAAASAEGVFVVGSQITLSINITNNNSVAQPFMALIEVRDSTGVTVFLALQSGTLEPSGSTEIGAAWQPEDAGTYQLRTFAVSGLMEVLSPVASSQITVVSS